MEKQIHFGRTLWLAAVLVGFSFAIGTVQAAQLVTFTRGQSIVVQSVEMRGEWYYFILDGGGEMGVPVKLVAKIEDYEAPPPSSIPPVASTAVAPPPAAPAVSQAASQAVPPPQAPEDSSARAADPASGSGPPQPDVAAQGNTDWRYKVRMSGGPRKGMLNGYGAGGPGAGGAAGRLPVGAGKPGTQRPYPPQQQNPQN